MAEGKYPYPVFKGPCLDCKDRFPLCHAECKKYIQAKEEHEKLCRDVEKRNNGINDINLYVIETTWKIKKKVKDSKHRQRK